MPSEVYIIALGAVAPTGTCAAVVAASSRAELGQAQLHEADGVGSCRIAKTADDGADESRAARMRRLLQRALAECSMQLPENVDVPLWLSAPSDVVAGDLVQPALRFGFARYGIPDTVRAVDGLVALKLATAAIRSGTVELACVAGVDVQTDGESLARLASQGLLATEAMPWGILPSEGAGALLIASDKACERLRLPRLARVRGVADALETSARRALPCTGQALTAVCHELLDSLANGERADDIYGDLNAERKRVDEWMYTAARIGGKCRDTVLISTPALQWGDLGHATGVLLALLAAVDLSHGHTHGPQALLWTAARDGIRAAALLTRCDDGTGSLEPRHGPDATQAAHDMELVETLLHEADFLTTLRAGHIAQRESAPECGDTGHARCERRLERHVDALRLTRALALACEGANRCIYPTLRVALERESSDRCYELLTQVDLSTEEVRRDVRAALAHGARPQHLALCERLQQHDDPALFELALWLSGDLQRTSDSFRWERALRAGPSTFALSVPYALARTASAHHLHDLYGWLHGGDEVAQASAALALLRLDRVRATAYLRALPGPALLPALALVCSVREETALLRACDDFGADPRSVLALGLLGTSNAVAALHDRLAHPTLAEHAGRALHLATGEALFEPHEVVVRTPDEELSEAERDARAAGDGEAGVERTSTRRFACDPAAWRPLRDAHFAKYPDGQRARLGKPLDRAADAAALTSPYLAPAVQQLCAESLLLVSGVDVKLRSEARIEDLRRAAQWAVRG